MLRSHVHFTCSMVWWNWWLSRKLFNRLVLINCLTRITRSVIVCYLCISNYTAMFSSRLSIRHIKITIERLLLVMSTWFKESTSGNIVTNCIQTILNIEVTSLGSRPVKITRILIETVTYSCAHINWVTSIGSDFRLMERHLIVHVWCCNIELSVCFAT